jgi:hypothetical protein
MLVVTFMPALVIVTRHHGMRAATVFAGVRSAHILMPVGQAAVSVAA